MLCALCNITISLKGNDFLMLFDLWGMLITYLTIMTQNGNFNLTFEYFLSAGTTTKKIKSQKPEICVQETLSQFLDFNTILYFVFVGKAVFIGFHKTSKFNHFDTCLSNSSLVCLHIFVLNGWYKLTMTWIQVKRRI